MSFDYHSARAKKARLAVGLKPFRLIFKILKILAFLSGLLLILLDDSIGWLILAFAIIPFILGNWWQGELHRLSPNLGSDKIEDLLASNILGNLSKNPSSDEIAKDE